MSKLISFVVSFSYYNQVEVWWNYLLQWVLQKELRPNHTCSSFTPNHFEISAKSVFYNSLLLLSFYFSLSFAWLFLLMSVRSKYRNWHIFSCCQTEHPSCKQEIESKNLKSFVNTAIEILAYHFKACVSSLIIQCSNIQAKLLSRSLSLSVSHKELPKLLPSHLILLLIWSLMLHPELGASLNSVSRRWKKENSSPRKTVGFFTLRLTNKTENSF